MAVVYSGISILCLLYFHHHPSHVGVTVRVKNTHDFFVEEATPAATSIL